MGQPDDWSQRTPLGNMAIYCTDGGIDKVIIALMESHLAKALSKD